MDKGRRRHHPKLLRSLIHRTIYVLLISLQLVVGNAQSGGNNTLEFLNLTQSARSTALAGGLVSVIDDDVALAYVNPAILNQSMHSRLSINQNFHFAGISHGFFSYGHYLSKYDLTTHVGINYIDYGTFDRADEFGNRQGEFDAGSVALTLGGGKQINERFSIGANLKLINARLEAFTSFALGADLGTTYTIPENRSAFGFVIKNIGIQLDPFFEDRELLPLDIQIGYSKRLAHIPFRFSIVAHRLNDWNLRFEDSSPITSSIFGEPVQEEGAISKFTDNLFRHFIFNGEFLIGTTENFRIRLGYNHLRRKELSVSTFRSLGGFSMGIGLKVKKFVFDYGVGYYHLAGGVNHISISTNLSEWRKKV